MNTPTRASMPELASYLLAAAGLLLVLQGGLLAALYAGLLVFALVHLLAPRLSATLDTQRSRLIAVAVLGSVIVLLLTMVVWEQRAFSCQTREVCRCC